jgi:tetratricopeptide (TPR) repeat protein
MSNYPIILGIYAQNQDTAIGEGRTLGKHNTLTYWYVRQLSEETFEVQPLNSNHIPSGIRSTVDKVDFPPRYRPQPDYYRTHTVPALNTLARKITMGEEALAAGDLDESERQFIKALMIDELNVDANFGLGEVYAEKKDVAKLKKVLDRILGLDQAFQEENRFKFNTFGISLRRNGYYEESITYYQESLKIQDKDENVYFNMARSFFGVGDMEKCIESLYKALDISPLFKEAKQFLKYCQKHQATA